MEILDLPSDRSVSVLLKKNNNIKKITVQKDDCVYNYFNKIIYSFKNKNFKSDYNKLFEDAIIREKINLF